MRLTHSSARAWRAFPRELPGLSGSRVLLDVATGKPRQLVSKQDTFFVVQAVRELYPRDDLSEVTVGGKRYLARRDEYGSDF